jgi:hypothetical protein
MFSLGTLFASGTGVEKDVEFAYAWFLRAANAGLPHAQYNVGLMHEQGNGVDRDPDQALTWYGKAAQAGLIEAQLALGNMLYGGRGVEARPAEALHWFQRAADQDHLPAALRLADIHEKEGRPGAAFALIRQFAERGHAEAQNNLGVMLENGIGTRTDLEAARTSYRQAADQGLDEAHLNLARVYRDGLGVTPDRKLAAYWIARARGETSAPPPTPGVSAKRVGPRPAGAPGWLQKAAAEHYTVQLIGSRDAKAMDDFIRRNGIAGQATRLQTVRGGKPWHFVVFGDFADRSAAQVAVNRLPGEARGGGPWIRRIGEVRDSLARE